MTDDEIRLMARQAAERDVVVPAGVPSRAAWVANQTLENVVTLTEAIRILSEAGYEILGPDDEPTHEMIRAGSNAVSMLTHEGARCCYRAMIRARKAP